MLTLDSLSALVGADAHPARPDGALQGECPVCGRRRYLEVLPFEDGTALVRCLAGCAAREILTALRVEEDTVRLDDTLQGFEVAHGLDLADPFASYTLGRGDLEELPPPEPLIRDTLDLRTVALLAGAPGTTKSFVALDWSACVATGVNWNDREVRAGRVLYIAGEGVHGIGPRLRAWEQERGTTIPHDALRLRPEAVQLTHAASVDRLVEYVERERFSLVVVDTLARSSVGVDENSAEGMGRIVAAVERLKRATGDGTVLLVHHTGKDGATIRGSSSLEGATDTAYLTIRDPLGVRLSRVKRKDGPRDDSTVLALHEIRVGEDEDAVSAVLRPVDKSQEREIVGSARDRAWTGYRLTFGDLEASRAELVRVLRADFDLSSTTAYRAVADWSRWAR